MRGVSNLRFPQRVAFFFGIIKISYFIQIGNVSCNQDDCYNVVRVGVYLIVQATPYSALAICISLTFIWYSRQGEGREREEGSLVFWFLFSFLFFVGFVLLLHRFLCIANWIWIPSPTMAHPVAWVTMQGAPCVLPDPFVSPCTHSVFIVIRSRWLSHLPFAVHLADLTLLSVCSPLFTWLSILFYSLFLFLSFPSLSLSLVAFPPKLVPWPFAAAKLLSLCSVALSDPLLLPPCFLLSSLLFSLLLSFPFSTHLFSP